VHEHADIVDSVVAPEVIVAAESTHTSILSGADVETNVAFCYVLAHMKREVYDGKKEIEEDDDDE